MTSTPDAPGVRLNAPAATTGRRGVGFAVVGVILTLLAPALYVIGTFAVSGGATAALIAIGVVVQAAGVAFTLAGVVGGIVALARGARPITRPLLAILGLPIGGVLLAIEIVVIFVATT